MAKFTSQEVSALQEGGNERAREIYFKEWDPQRHSYPDSSHLDRLRDFIKHVYVERRYAGGKNIDDPPRVKGERDDYEESRRSNTDHSGSRSPPYNDPYERRFGDRPGSAGRSDDRNSRFNHDTRSPGYDQGDYRSPSRFEMRDEIRRDDKAGNDVQSPKSHNINSDELPKPGLSNHQKGVYISSPPMVRPVREILGTDIPPLRVGELPKVNGGKALNSPSKTEVSNSIKGPNDGSSVELKRVTFGSLIDFSADSEPPAAGKGLETFPQQTVSTPANSGGWASFDISSQHKAPEKASNVGDLESVFAQMSVHASTQAVNSTISPAASTNSFPIASNGGQWSAVQQPSFPNSNQSTNQPIHTLVSAPLLGSSFPSAVHGATAVLDGQSSRPVTHLSHRPTTFGNSQNPLESKAGGRKELPADLFTGLYSTSPASYPGWRMGPHHGMAYRVQYPVMMQPTVYGVVQQPTAYGAVQQPAAYGAVQQPAAYGAVQQPAAYGAVQQPVTTFHNPPISTNPFDLGNESAPVPNPMINPSASLQAGVPNMSNPLSLPNSSKMGAVPSQWMPQQQFPSISSVSPGPYMMQQFPLDIPHQLSSNYFPAMNQGTGVGSEPTPHGASSGSQLPARTNANLGSLNSPVSSVGGNPFG